MKNKKSKQEKAELYFLGALIRKKLNNIIYIGSDKE